MSDLFEGNPTDLVSYAERLLPCLSELIIDSHTYVWLNHIKTKQTYGPVLSVTWLLRVSRANEDQPGTYWHYFTLLIFSSQLIDATMIAGNIEEKISICANERCVQLLVSRSFVLVIGSQPMGFRADQAGRITNQLDWSEGLSLQTKHPYWLELDPGVNIYSMSMMPSRVASCCFSSNQTNISAYQHIHRRQQTKNKEQQAADLAGNRAAISGGSDGVSVKIGMVGTGSFAQGFMQIFNAHPLVDMIIQCDLDHDKLTDITRKHQVEDVSHYLDDLHKTDEDTVIAITQHSIYAPQAIQAQKDGNHVYSAVPTGVTLDETISLVRTVEETGRIYMIVETSFDTESISCFSQYNRGSFAQIVYGEVEYNDDCDHGFCDVVKWRGDKDWIKYAGSQPMYYPTYFACVISLVTGTYMPWIFYLVYSDCTADVIYRKKANSCANEFSNQAGLILASDGSICRINEFRRISLPGTVLLSLYGTEGGFEHNTRFAIWVTKDPNQQNPLDDQLACTGITTWPNTDRMASMNLVMASDRTHLETAPIHPDFLLLDTNIGHPNGHCGSQQFLVGNLYKACISSKLPPNNTWDTARYVVQTLSPTS